MREAPSITVIGNLLEKGAGVKAFDPVASEEARKFFKIQLSTVKHLRLQWKG